MRTLAILLILTGCARASIALQCQHQAGPEPDPTAGLLGLAGMSIRESDPAWIDWTRRIDQCVAEVEAHRTSLN